MNKVIGGVTALAVLVGAGAVGSVYGTDFVDWLRFGEESSAAQEKPPETIAKLPVSEMDARHIGRRRASWACTFGHCHR